MPQLTDKRDRYYFHILMWVGAKPHAGLNHIVIKHAQQAKSHPLRIMIFSERKCMPGTQPAMFSDTARISFVQRFFHL
jgi:hypothetical protein